MFDVYLFDILFIWFLLSQILMINKLFTEGHKIFSRKNDLSSRNKVYHGRFWNLGEKPGTLWNFIFHVKKL